MTVKLVEDRAAALARVLADQSEALDRQRTALRQAEAEARTGESIKVVGTERPGDGPSVAERRAWALAAAIRRRPVIIRPGAGSPKVNALFMVGGSPYIAKNVDPVMWETISPDGWNRHELRWAFRQRRRESELLVAVYGLAECLRQGLVTEHDRVVFELDQVTAGRELPGLEGL